MDHFREIKNNLSWHKEGKFEVELVNGTITKLNFCEPGTGPEGLGKCLTSTNFKYLQNVYDCLGDLFTFIEEENKRLGYKYSREVALPHVYNNASSETKLRPLMNYDSPENDNLSNRASSGDHLDDIELTA